MRQVKLPYVHIDRRHGLPSSQVHELNIDNDNNVWIATPAGLTMYDGLRVSVYSKKHGLSTHGLRCINLLEGDLFVGTDLGLDYAQLPLLEGKEGLFASVIKTNELNLGFCEAIELSEKNLWLGTSKGLYRLPRNAQGHPEDIAKNHELIYADYIETIISIADDELLVLGRSQGIKHIRDGHQQTLNLDFLNYEEVQLITMDYTRVGVVLIVTDNHIYHYALKSNEVHQYAFIQTLKADITAVYANHSELWLGTSKGLYTAHFSPGETDLDLTQSLNGRYIKDIKVDNQNNIYVATNDSGLYKFSALRNVLTEFNSDSIFSLRATEQTDEYYLATLRGVKLYHPLVGIYPHPDLKDLDLHCWDVLTISQGLLIASTKGLLLLDKNAEIQDITQQNAVAVAPNRIFQAIKEGTLLGTQTGLVFIHADLSLHTISIDAELDFGYVYSLACDKKGNLFVGTLGKGLWFGEKHNEASDKGIPNYSFRPLKFSTLSDKSNIYCIRVGADGRVAISFDNKILVLSADFTNARIVYTSENAVAAWSLQWESAYSLWVGGSSGLYEIDVHEKSTTRSIETIPGSNIWEFNSSRSLEFISIDKNYFSKYTRNNSHSSKNTVLACAMRDNLTILSLMNLRSIIARPKFIKCSHEWHGSKLEKISEHKVLTGKWFLKIKPETNWAIDVESMQYQYRLVGFNLAWSELGQHPEIVFNSLPPGKYIVEVQAYSMVVGWGDVTQLFEFEVLGKNILNKSLAFLTDAYLFTKTSLLTHLRNKQQINSIRDADSYVKKRTYELEVQKQQLDQLNQQLSNEIMIDSLTGVANRRYLDKILLSAISTAKRKKNVLSIMLLDVDNFKSYNDIYGHQVGDEALRKIATLISNVMRRCGDTFARYGGEEFMLVLPESTASEAMVLAKRIHKAINDAAIPHVGNNDVAAYLTVSIGLASVDCSKNNSFLIDELISIADNNLYEAKNLGRNQTNHSEIANI